MTKATVLAIFMAVLVLGMVTMESQGQEMCHEYFTGTEICDAKQCAAQCSSKWKGSGKCIAQSKNCLCTFHCKN
ncbi:hypothetical protein EUTSA_v10029330mg [Eutrema salsugineum]|uniref:Knottin scorpion toxin-like domain-containing protein n=1 Tax=Eutrema salsugineum TaxID=72664 RepID=V4KLJ5_EUTSA|nr:hypothetical protein EUTSA_v10029330mg [Eutrema salsugineum]